MPFMGPLYSVLVCRVAFRSVSGNAGRGSWSCAAVEEDEDEADVRRLTCDVEHRHRPPAGCVRVSAGVSLQLPELTSTRARAQRMVQSSGGSGASARCVAAYEVCVVCRRAGPRVGVPRPAAVRARGHGAGQCTVFFGV